MGKAQNLIISASTPYTGLLWYVKIITSLFSRLRHRDSLAQTLIPSRY
jgi:hypothetical protein